MEGSDARDEPSSVDRRLDAISGEYLEALAAGRTPDRAELLARHPDLAGPLEEFFRDHDRLRGAMDAGASAEPVRPVLAAGERLGGYEIIEEIARGGMGIVYRARHAALGRDVALKILHPARHGSEDDLRRFLREAETAAGLEGPGIAPVYEVGESGGRPFIAMRLLPGGDLRLRLAEFSKNPRAAATLIENVARAIAFAHERGVLHRDLKPANILFDGEGNPFVSDFGLAKRVGDDPGLTRTGEILGTPSYLAPEVLDGRKGAATAAADIFGLGAILYEVLAGSPPFPGISHLDVIDRIRRDEPERPGIRNRRVPRDLETICLKCLEKDPARRYPTAAALAADLARFAAGQPIEARPASAAVRLVRWCRRHPAGVGIGATAFLAVLSVAIVSAAAAARLEIERNIAIERLREASLAGARAARHAGRIGQRFESLARLAEAARIRPDAEIRSEAVGCLALADLRLEATFDGGMTGLDHYPVPDASFERCVLRTAPGRIAVCAIGGGGQIASFEETGSHFCFGPDGQYVAVPGFAAGTWRLQVWRIGMPERPIIVEPRLAGLQGFDFEPAGGGITVGLRDGSLLRYDLASGSAVTLLGRAEGLVQPSGVRWHPGAEFLAVCDIDRSCVQIWQGRERIREIAAGSARSIAWHPRRPLLAVGGVPEISLWDALTGSRLVDLAGHRSDVVSIAFHPTAELLASTSFDRTVRLWDIPTGKELAAGSGFGFVRFAPDGRLATLSGRLDLVMYKCAPGEERKALPYFRGGFKSIWAVAFGPGDRYLAAAGDKGAAVWELPEGRLLAEIPGGAGKFVAFEPDGETIVTWGSRGLRTWRVTGGQPAEPDPWAAAAAHPGLDGRGAGLSGASLGGGRLALLAQTSPSAIFVVDREGCSPPRRIEGLPALAFVAIDPEGRRIAGGMFHGSGVRIWDAESGAVIRDLPVAGSANIAFSPDGSTLAVASSRGLSFWDTAAWEERAAAPASVVSELYGLLSYAPCGDFLVFSELIAPPRILDARTGEIVTELLLRDLPAARAVAFGNTGRYATVATDDDRLHLWDLARIRSELAVIGLGW